MVGLRKEAHSLHYKSYQDAATHTTNESHEAHNNMPPYRPVLYLIKVKDER